MKTWIASLLVLTAAPATAGVNLVANGSFETFDFSGWTQFDNTGFTGVSWDFGWPSVAPTDGNAQAYFGPVWSTGGILQSIATTPGRLYDVSFDLYAFPGGQSFSADFGSTNLLSGALAEGLAYTSFRSTVLATGSSTVLSFTTRHDPSYYLVDNVRVVAAGGVPEPTSWAMLITGLLMVGVARRRRVAQATT